MTDKAEDWCEQFRELLDDGVLRLVRYTVVREVEEALCVWRNQAHVMIALGRKDWPIARDLTPVEARHVAALLIHLADECDVECGSSRKPGADG